MRLVFSASALCLCLAVLAAHAAAPQASAPAATPPSATQVANEAAARHAKRTACLKEARTHKLVGADRTAFIKRCIDAPPQAISANRISPPDRP
ncbi:MAG TPA: PsiF family protein [Steroidobacteraceae bacterium]|jgi:hypothetical protein|nr:PsiF family protein [Steroidobacteraceae bacterium]